MDPTVVQDLINKLDEFLDHPKDKDLEREYVEMLKQRSVYSFLSILYRINYPRLPLLLNITHDIVRVYSSKPIENEKASDEDSSSSESEASSDLSSEDTESNSEKEEPKHCTGTAFDLLMEEESD